MPTLRIVLLCVGAAILYGVAQDHVTARVCVEYFTVAHPPIFGGITSPTLLAFGWGVIATWWMGVFLGIPLAVFARSGRRPKLEARDLMRPIGRLLIAMAVLSALAGLVGYVLGRSAFGDALGYFAPISDQLPKARRPLFFADAFAHEMAYASGGLGGVVIWAWAWWRRGKLARSMARPSTSV